MAVKSHSQIDQRSLCLARRVVELIDADRDRMGLEKARATCARWMRDAPCEAIAEWERILREDWQTVRTVLLDEGEKGCRLRQSSPFCGVLSAQERWAIFSRFRHEPKAA